MKTHRLKSTLPSFGLMVGLLTAIPALMADTIYHGVAPYSVTVHDSSTLFNNNVTFNGSRASLVGPAQVQNVGTGGDVLSGFVTATFEADVGFVFTNVLLEIGTWTYGNGQGGYDHDGTWSIPGSTYVGDTNPPEAFDLTSWSGSGASGSFRRENYAWFNGGGSDFQSIMGPFGTYPIVLDNVSSFTVTIDMTLRALGTSGYTISAMNVHAVTTEGYPETPAVPDGPIPFALLGSVLIGTMLLGARARRAQYGRLAA